MAPRPELGHRRSASPTLVLIAALLGFFMVGLDVSAVNVALPAIGRSLGGATAGLQWIVDAYTLMFAALLISAGALSDRIGANRAFAGGLAVFAAASAACGLAPGLGFLVGARLIQGAAAAVQLPSSLALVRQAFPDPARRARAIARWTVGGAVSLAAGPVAGGALTSALGWRAIFFVNLPVGIATLAVLTRAPRSPRRTARLDPAGQLTAVIALAALTFGVIEGGSGGFGRPVVLGCLLLSAVAMAAFVAVEARVADPMVPLRLFGSPTVTVCVVIGFAVNAAFYGVIFVLSLFFQEIRGLSPVSAGLMFLPMTAVMPFANLASARVAGRVGHWVPIAVGQLIAAGGLLGLLAVHPRTDWLLIAALLIPLGAGGGFAVPSLTVVMLDAIPAEQAGMAAGVLNSSRQVGGALAVAVFGALVAHRWSFASGMRASLLIAAILLLATTAAALSVPRRQRQ
jgi:DHA2 family methylenomycin A resistance protein-like MFS transporter